MNPSDFGKSAGPGQPPNRFSFGTSTSQAPRSPQLSPVRSPSNLRRPAAAGRVRLPSLGYGSPDFVNSCYQPAMPDMSEVQRPESRSSGFESSPTLASHPSFTTRPQTSIESPPNGYQSFVKDDDHDDPVPYAGRSLVATRNSGTTVAAMVSGVQDPRRTRSPPHSTNGTIAPDSSLSFPQRSARPSDFPVHNANAFVSPKTNTPPLDFQKKPNAHARPSFGASSSAAYSPPAWDESSSMEGHFQDLGSRQKLSPGQVNDVRNGNLQKRSRSPPLSGSWQENPPVGNEAKRPFSPLGMGTQSDAFRVTSDPQTSQRVLPSLKNGAVKSIPARNASDYVSKRTRSPNVASDKALLGTSFSSADGAEREIQAKAKRLARFKEELTEDSKNSIDIGDRDIPAGGHEQSKQRQTGRSNHSTEDSTNENNLSNLEGLGDSRSIVGVCPDMCPESERAERERKGDLDQYERLDGDRNQTNRFLAVKKYTRTAEREAYLIRPMPILQKTIEYLLSLLDKPYDSEFLGKYNFLWDRMRAIRMDLRMQHIFNVGAITMLEQMIRLHVIAMHELCEYTKGEGFSEGFDAHLNIEQMNKTSVELFQMYDDHRKKGINVPSEKEFRGYYALLKLDKHPGYKVEPSELSLDLAKMTPEIRQTAEVLFARDVARACRTGNFIAFFRLAKKATYLQACLMHAHFAKLRTQALASLYSGLQTKQGIPVSHVAKWLAIEGEDVENLLVYYGFSIKEFEEPYMVKEGPFLNSDKDFPTKCSRLVQLKKSTMIVGDVSSSSQETSLPQPTRKIEVPTNYKLDTKTTASCVDKKRPIHVIDEEMPTPQAVPSPKFGKQKQRVIGRYEVEQADTEKNHVANAPVAPWTFTPDHSSQNILPVVVGVPEKRRTDSPFPVIPDLKATYKVEDMPLQPGFRMPLKEDLSSVEEDNQTNNIIHQIVPTNPSKDEELPDIDQECKNDDDVMENYIDEEVAQAKLKLIIRLWRRRASRHKELRQRRKMAADAAISSLSLGPPIQMIQEEPSNNLEFDIDHIMRKRCRIFEQSWSKLNLSEVILNEVATRNPDAKCLCWKLVLCSQADEGDQRCSNSQLAGPWLCSKLMPDRQKDKDDDELLISSPGLSIWRKWCPGQTRNEQTCCLSVVRDSSFGSLNEVVAGASAVLFMVSENIPMSVQRIKLHNLIMAIRPGSSLPLLVFSGKSDRKSSDHFSSIVGELGLNTVDKSRIQSFSVLFLVGDEEREDSNGFFSDGRLREGLRWLASESPIQPDLEYIKMSELLLTRLRPSLDALENMSDAEVGPDTCISAFNEALDWCTEEISAAARANATGWPCPELVSLGDFGSESMVIKSYLPSIGWSAESTTDPLVSAARKCKLASFGDDVSWLDEGTTMGDQLEKMSCNLESSVTRYLTESSGLMGYPLAAKEAHVTIQTNARLELRDTSYHIIVKWVNVFRRIFNWQLGKLSSSSVYVLRSHLVDSRSRLLVKSGSEIGDTWYPCVNQLSLDQVIHVGSIPLLLKRHQPKPYISLPASIYALSNRDGDVLANKSLVTWTANNEQASSEIGSLDVAGDGERQPVAKPPTPPKTTKEADKLSMLLEQCNIVQKRIEEKLSIYF
ncbi:SAC3 family protein B [Linum grandiflorum]